MHSSVVPDSIYEYIVQHVAAGDPGHYLLLNSIILQLPGLGCLGWLSWAALVWVGLCLISKKTPTSSLMTAEQTPHTRTHHTAAAAAGNPFKEKYKPKVVADRS